MYYYTKLTINRSEEDGTVLAAGGLFKQTFEINTISFERAMEYVSQLTHKYRPCQVINLSTTLRKGEHDNV